MSLVCFDERLRSAAHKEGFTILPYNRLYTTELGANSAGPILPSARAAGVNAVKGKYGRGGIEPPRRSFRSRDSGLFDTIGGYVHLFKRLTGL